MKWTSIRNFLKIPKIITGKGTKIAIIDGGFYCHPDIISDENRNCYLVKTHLTHPEPIKLTHETNQNSGLHGLWTASAAGGSGRLSNGMYSGVAPEADMYLIEAGKINTTEELEQNIGKALGWIKRNAKAYGIKGVVLTVVGQKDTGLLPWQVDPLRILCEELAQQGVLVVASSGNTHELTSGSVISPSVLAVGGIILPKNGEIHGAKSFLGSRGLTFESKWNPDILAPAMNVVLPFPFKSEEERLNHYTAMGDDLPLDYACQWGTSYAAPIVLGLAACIWQKYPNYSAEQVKKTLVFSSIFNENWDSLKAGLVSGESLNFAMHWDDKEVKNNNENSNYACWKYWKEQPLPRKLDLLNLESSEINNILLSFLPGRVPREAISYVQSLLHHDSHKIRTIAITVLASRPAIISYLDVLCCLKDESPNVKMGGLYALKLCPNLWSDLTPIVCNLINAKNTDIRYNACKLAALIKSRQFINPLLHGLEEDARHKRIGTFGERHIALEKITGIEVPRDPEWQEGEDPYSTRSVNALIKMASKWHSMFI